MRRRNHADPAGIERIIDELAIDVRPEARACGAVAVDLEVDVDHRRAANLYRRAGFRPLPRARWVLAPS